MGHIVPVLLAFILNCSGVNIFTKKDDYDCLPYLSYVIFLLSVFFLLLDCSLLPSAFLKINFLAILIIEFVVALTFMEFITNSLWFPLEMTFLTLLPKIPQYVAELMQKFGYKCTGICAVLGILKWHGTLLFASYLLSIFFFICVTQTTCVLDFSILKDCGGNAFIEDTKERGKQCYDEMVGSIKPNKRSKRKRRSSSDKDSRGESSGFIKSQKHLDCRRDPYHYADTFDSDEDSINADLAF